MGAKILATDKAFMKRPLKTLYEPAPKNVNRFPSIDLLCLKGSTAHFMRESDNLARER
jgi:hypothetical protein